METMPDVPDEGYDYITWMITRPSNDSYELHTTVQEAAQAILTEDWANNTYPNGVVAWIQYFNRTNNHWYAYFSFVTNEGHVPQGDIDDLTNIANS